jgi:poly-gamma-glutamate capsule biosynthesis protein CapA/YwtB (metallophosphatase superfamily)
VAAGYPLLHDFGAAALQAAILTGALLLAPLPGPRDDEVDPPPIIRLAAGGDAMLSRHIGRLARQKQDPAFALREIAPFFAAADLAFLNLESPFHPRKGYVTQGMVFKAEPEMIEGLTLAGIDVASTANNHARDQGSSGLEYTVKWLEEHNIAPVGTGLSEAQVHAGTVIERHGVRFGFLAYTYDQANGNHADHDPRVAVMDVEQMKRDVTKLRSDRRAAVVVVSMHGGTEYAPKPHSSQIAFARAAIDAGAQLVIGHHPHVIQPAEYYRNGLIFYSLGNLVFDQFHREDTQVGQVAEVTFRGAEIESARLHDISLAGGVTRFIGESVLVERSQTR